jgi:hypothetical protein
MSDVFDKPFYKSRRLLSPEEREAIEHAPPMQVPGDWLLVIADALQVCLNSSRDGFDLELATEIVQAIRRHASEARS